MILGIDEAGRGPWAGPLVVGAVVLGGVQVDGLNDSKKLSKKKRQTLYDEIAANAPAYASGWVTAAELDNLGMSQALVVATRRAVEQIKVPYSEIIIDGTVNFLKDTTKGKYVQTMAKADALVPSVSAASIVAKVERDNYMAALDDKYPGYGFKSHAGYGVAAHRDAIDKLGVTPEHRLSFAPLSKYNLSAENPSPDDHPTSGALTTRQIGDGGETAAANDLESRGHTILERNWRTKFCEIDIVSRRGDTIYFVEVKHRKNDKAGDGLVYITPKKLKQMRFAARLYAHLHHLNEANLQLLAVSTTGAPPRVERVVDVS